MRLAAKGLSSKALLELDVTLRLDQHGQADVLCGSARLFARSRIRGARNVDARRDSLFELGALALDALEQLPARKGRVHLQVAEMLGDQVQLLVVRRKDDDLSQRAQSRDEPTRLGVRIRHEVPLRVA